MVLEHKAHMLRLKKRENRLAIIINNCDCLLYFALIQMPCEKELLCKTKFPFLTVTFFFYGRLYHVGKWVSKLPEKIAVPIKIERAKF
jgi:hypothetical protein